MRHAHEFFTRFLPFHQMTQANDLTGGRHWLFAKTGEVYAIYLPAGGSPELDLRGAPGSAFEVKWYDPRFAGDLQNGTVRTVSGGRRVQLGDAPKERGKDWAVLVRKAK